MVDKEIRAASLPFDELVDMLEVWAEGRPTVEAAVELLASHRYWLTDPHFLERCIEVHSTGWSRNGSVQAIASIDWNAAFNLASEAAAGATAIRKLACSLADGDRHTVALGHELARLDDHDLALLVRVIRRLASPR